MIKIIICDDCKKYSPEKIKMIRIGNHTNALNGLRYFQLHLKNSILRPPVGCPVTPFRKGL